MVPAPAPRLPSGQRIYAVGDIHGMAGLLEQRQADIDRDLAAYPIAEACEVYLGDMIDRGPESRRVIQRLIERRQHRNVVCLVGNHELHMLRACSDISAFESWVRAFGGAETLNSFGIRPPIEGQFERAMAEWRSVLTEDEVAFLHSLKVWHLAGDYLFVHAGIRPGIPLMRQTVADITEIRQPFLHSMHPCEYRVVHGHSPCDAIEILPHRINLDTGAFWTGILSCVAIEGDAVRILEHGLPGRPQALR